MGGSLLWTSEGSPFLIPFVDVSPHPRSGASLVALERGRDHPKRE
jgi:hypothetical protein